MALKAAVDKHEAEGRVGRLSPDDFVPLKRLGNGGVGSVHLVQLVGTNRLFAMKILVKQEMHDRNKLHRVRTEGQILETVDHPFVATLYSAFQTETHLYFVLEYCGGGELSRGSQKEPEHRFRSDYGEVLRRGGSRRAAVPPPRPSSSTATSSPRTSSFARMGTSS